MTFSIQEGQELAGRYNLLHAIGGAPAAAAMPEKWLALDSVTNERVELLLFVDSTADEARLLSAHQKVRGLIHPNIVRLIDAGAVEGILYAAQPQVRNATLLRERQGSFKANWPLLEQLLDTLTFAHGAGVAHGHLTEDAVTVSPSGDVVISGFGIPPSFVAANLPEQPDISDDIHALGILLYQSLTGNVWVPGQTFESNSPVSTATKQILMQMLDANPYTRPTDLVEVRQILSAEAQGNDATELGAPASFQRAVAPSTASTTSDPETITPTTTQGSAAHLPSRAQQQLPMSMVAGGLVFLLLLAGFVFFVLPQGQSDVQTSANQTATPAAKIEPAKQNDSVEPAADQLMTPLESAQMARFEEEGKTLATAIVRKQVELEDRGVRLWASDEFDALVKAAEDADSLYRESAFDDAMLQYQTVLAQFESLQQQIPQVLSDAIAAGEMALLNEDTINALSNWTIVTAIEPGNASHQQQLERATNMARVVAHLTQGAEFEDNGDLVAARVEYEAASKLDPLMQRASNAVSRIRNKITQSRFKDAMSEGFTQLANNNYEAARTAFSTAAGILPASSEPADGLLQIEIAQRMDTVNEYQQIAEAAMESEQWETAIEALQSVQSLDQTLLFATEGINRATARLEMKNQMQPFLTLPDAMQTDEGLAAARTLLVQASRISNQGPLLRADLTRLSRLISVARIPVPVTLTSDNRTEVTVYKIGSLGNFTEHALQLIPGRYTVVGKRRGYRDVQQKVTVVGGQVLPPVTVSCNEKI